MIFILIRKIAIPVVLIVAWVGTGFLASAMIKKNDEILLTFTNEQTIHLDMKTVDGLIDLIPPQVIMVEKNTEEVKPDKGEEKPKITTRRRQIKSK